MTPQRRAIAAERGDGKPDDVASQVQQQSERADCRARGVPAGRGRCGGVLASGRAEIAVSLGQALPELAGARRGSRPIRPSAVR